MKVNPIILYIKHKWSEKPYFKRKRKKLKSDFREILEAEIRADTNKR